jgi:ankyrin repeat protein
MQEIADYEYLCQLIAEGDLALLEEAAAVLDDFPQGKDAYHGQQWITYAVAGGALPAIQWMLSKNVRLDFREEDGMTVLLHAIDRRQADRYAVLELLLQYGAPIDQQGLNDWTPAHMAAARNDVSALQILVHYGADLTIRTRIDDYATPLEEARLLKRQEAVRYLESI